MTGIRSRGRPGDLALVPAKEREEVAVGVNRGELPGTEVRRSQFGARDVVKHPRGLQFANRASTSETSIRQLAVPARNDSAPEQIGRRSRSSRAPIVVRGSPEVQYGVVSNQNGEVGGLVRRVEAEPVAVVRDRYAHVADRQGGDGSLK